MRHAALLSVGRSIGAFALPLVAAAYTAFTIESALQYWRGRGGQWKGRYQASMRCDRREHDDASETLSGKGHRDENFPVASWLIGAEERRGHTGFLSFRAGGRRHRRSSRPWARKQKLASLDHLAEALTGGGATDSEAEPLRIALAERGLSPSHALDLVEAFRLDVTKIRYANWAELMDYCRLSAMPVGRFVLDVHGEEPAPGAASDALCAALQMINHLQDCAADYRASTVSICR